MHDVIAEINFNAMFVHNRMYALHQPMHLIRLKISPIKTKKLLKPS